MSDNKPEDAALKEMAKQIPELKEMAEKNYYKVLLRPWKLAIAAVVIGVATGFVINFFTPSSGTHMETSKIEEITKTILSASVTINGLFVAFIPLISFFFIREIKEKQEEIKTRWEKDEKAYEGNEESMKVVDSFYGYAGMTWHNVRSGVVKYTRTYLYVSVTSAFSLLYIYILLCPFERQGAVAFLIIDVCLLIILMSGIYPILHFALYKPAMRLVKIVVPKEIVTKIEYED